MPGQPQLGSNPILGVDCTSLSVSDLGGLPSALVIPAGHPFRLSVEFRFDGALAMWLMATIVPYKVTYYYEGYGNLPEGSLGPKTGNTVAGKIVYNGADTSVDGTLNVPGTYKLSGVVVFNGPPVTAFIEGPLIQIQ